MHLRDRADAGRRLAAALQLRRLEHPIVLALPRGGVPVALEIARALGAPLDVLIVRKLGSPLQPELAVGALGENGATVLNPDVVDALRVKDDELRRITEREAAEIERRRTRYRGGRPMIAIEGRTVVIVDDGLATGATARAAVAVCRALGAARVVVAVPIGAADSVEVLSREADEVVVLATPEHFAAVGAWYDDFRQVADEEVERMLSAAAGSTG